MKPIATTYRFAKEADREAIDRLWATTDIPKSPTAFPEIVAERDGAIIGFVARRDDEKGVLIEPLISPNVFVYIRLWNAMECALKAFGVTTYLFRIEPHRARHELLLKSAEKKGMVRSLGQHDGFTWWERTAA